MALILLAQNNGRVNTVMDLQAEQNASNFFTRCGPVNFSRSTAPWKQAVSQSVSPLR
jgi:hypothetical protein